MDSSTYYDGRDDGDSPVLSPLTPNFDQYIARGPDEASYFTNPTGGYTTLPGASAAGAPSAGPYPMNGTRSHLEPRDSGFSLDFLPTGDTLPRAYPGTIDPSVTSPNPNPPPPTFDMDGSSSQPFCDDRDSSEDMRLSQYGQSSLDGYTFLPSPPDAEGGSMDGSGAHETTTSRTTRSSKKGSSRKRRHQANGKEKNVGGSDEKRQTRPTTQLRTASRAPKRYSQATARKPAESPEEVKARAAHNQVEQQYRKRLNQQFERLLAVLPQPNYDEDAMEGDGDCGGGGDGSGRGGGGTVSTAGMEKRISKAEVLDLARRRIKVLERERSALEKQQRELMGNMGRMQDEWTRRFGTSVPTKTER